ncbi:MAG: succinate dehydrogenase, hydrophobic membrane anchor protein [Sphingomonadaceae bacterium]
MATGFSSASGIKRVRGLGAARAGAHHWWVQRVTAAGNLLLLAWFAASLVLLPDLARSTVVAWVSLPLNAILLALLAVSAVWHMRLGVQVMLEDYLKAEGTRRLAFLLLDFYAVVIVAVSLFAILKIAVGAVDA